MSDLRTLAEAATPGPWEVEDYDGGWLVNEPTGYIVVDYSIIDYDSNPNKGSDAAFIAAANPQAVLALLDESQRLRDALRQTHVYIWSRAPEAAYHEPGDKPDTCHACAALRGTSD